MPLEEHGYSLCHPARSLGTLDEVVPKDVDALRHVTECLESEREEPPATVAAVTVPASQAWEPNIVAFALAETISFGEDAGSHLLHDKVSILRGKHLVAGLDQVNKRLSLLCCSLRVNMSRCHHLFGAFKEHASGGIDQALSQERCCTIEVNASVTERDKRSTCIVQRMNQSSSSPTSWLRRSSTPSSTHCELSGP